MAPDLQLVIAGGGAAGFFAAITAAEALGAAGRVTLLESSAHLLAKVRVSGGGRCNVTNEREDPRQLAAFYPRGGRELLGPLTRFGPRETKAWFRSRGVEVHAEPDGRVFPNANDSAVIVNCLERSAAQAAVAVRLRAGLAGATHDGTRFQVRLATGETLAADRLLLATGGTRGSAGPEVAAAFGHTIVPPVPSLFTFHAADDRLAGLAGLAVEHVVTSLQGTKLRAEGPLLVTHEGLSGPAILRLSAWGAREFAAADYRATIAVNFLPAETTESVAGKLNSLRMTHGKKQLHTWSPVDVPARLWEKLVAAAGARPGLTWAEVSGEVAKSLARQLTAATFATTGKSMNKEEFVTCGGVSLREVDFRTMESRRRPGLFFAGELLDVDGVTGGFNFQAAWTTGWHAGRAMASVRD